MDQADCGKGSTDAGVNGVDSCTPGSLSTAAAGPSQLQSIQDVMNQLFRMEQRFTTLESKVDAVLERQQRNTASLGSTACPPEAESGHRILESWSFQRNLRPANESEPLMKKVAVHEQKMEEKEFPLASLTVCKNSKGEVLPAFRFFYMCLAGGAEWPCYTVIPSKTWSTLHEDPLASKQRWYCVCCGAKYMTKFGMIVEIEIQGDFYYVKADIPPGLEDTRRMSLEQRLMPSGPRDLVARLTHVTPHTKQILRPITQRDVMVNIKFADQNAYKILAGAYETLPHFDWRQI